jgi:hypothetical protein
VRAKVIRIDRSEERVVCLRIELATPLEKLESRFGAGRRQLKIVRGHVAIGAGPPVSAQTVKAPVQERAETARDRIARLRAAVELTPWFNAHPGVLRRGRGATNPHGERGDEDKAPHSKLKSRVHGVRSFDRRIRARCPASSTHGHVIRS